MVVDELGAVRLQLDGGPHHRVEVGEVVVQVDALVAVAAQSPTGQLRALGREEDVVTEHLPTSGSGCLDCGVPQGSALGPK